MVCELFPQTRFYGGGVWFAIKDVPQVVPAWRQWVPGLPVEATSSIAVQRLPSLPDLPKPLQGASVLHLRFTHLGSAAEGAALFAPMRAIAPTVLDAVGEMPYTSIGMVHLDPPDPMPYWDRTTMLRELPSEAIDAFVALTGPDSHCPLTTVEIRRLGGAMDREPVIPNAVPTRGIPYVLFAFGVGGPEKEHLMRSYLAKLMGGLEQWSAGRLMVNFLSADEATTPAAKHRLWSGALPAPGRCQENLRPSEHLPDEPQHHTRVTYSPPRGAVPRLDTCRQLFR
jgi:hypothetical protein